jgi:hypothetical protein
MLMPCGQPLGAKHESHLLCTVHENDLVLLGDTAITIIRPQPCTVVNVGITCQAPASGSGNGPYETFHTQHNRVLTSANASNTQFPLGHLQV